MTLSTLNVPAALISSSWFCMTDRRVSSSARAGSAALCAEEVTDRYRTRAGERCFKHARNIVGAIYVQCVVVDAARSRDDG
jgi:hypothetical protein